MNEIGRLDAEDKKNLNKSLAEIEEMLKKKHTRKAEKKILEITKTPNYFIREYFGTKMAKTSYPELMEKIATKMLEHKFYGVRATALFFFYKMDEKHLEKIFAILEKTYDSVPWEVETIINEMWKHHPDRMKEKMLVWIEDEDEKKRALAFHGMDNIARLDTNYIMEFISKAIDDKSVEVQKKITHILTQVVRVNPILVFPYVHEWLLDANDQRIKTIWVSMKKLSNIVVQRSKRDQSHELVMLTEQTIEDWKRDPNNKVAEMGNKLHNIIKRR